MKKIIFFFITFFLFILKIEGLTLPNEVDITADSMMLTNLDANNVIFTKNADKVQSIASLTKIMTAYVTLKNVDNLDKKVTVTSADLENLWVYTVAGLQPGDYVSYRDLLYGLILISGADCAQTLANKIGGSVPEFVRMMNEEAVKLGLNHTRFEDPAGGEDGNVSTARELTLLLKEALNNPEFKTIFGTNYYTMKNGLHVVNYTQAYATFHGLDPYLLTGNKSGYTDTAGLLLASTANINGTNYMLIVCKSQINQYMSAHVLDSYKIYDYLKTLSFTEYKVLEKGTLLKQVPVQNATTSLYYIVADKDVTFTLPVGMEDKVRLDYHIVDHITADNKVGDNLGFIDIYVGDELVDTYHIYLYDEIFVPVEESQTVIIVIILLIFLCLILLCINLLITPKKVKLKYKKGIEELKLN